MIKHTVKHYISGMLLMSAICAAVALWPPYELPNVLCAFSSGVALAGYFWMRVYEENMIARMLFEQVICLLTAEMNNADRERIFAVAKERLINKRDRQ